MFFIILTFFAALFIEGLGSLVSVIGISALFGANPIIIALAIALDVGKVVTVSLLYTYWKSLSKLMKAYALLAATVTMVITSSGAAGYLTGEFQKSIMGTKEGELKVSVLKDQQAKYELRKKQIDDQIAALPAKTTVNQRLRLMNGFKAEQKALDTKIAEIDKSLPALQVSQIGTEAKAGPIVSISKALNVPMEKAVSYVIGMIIFVFDPLAIFLIIAGNFLWARRKAEIALAKQPVVVAAEPVVEPVVETMEPVIETPVKPEGFQSFTPTDLADEFPPSPKRDDVFFHNGLHKLFIYDGERWVGANTLSVPKSEPVEIKNTWFDGNTFQPPEIKNAWYDENTFQPVEEHRFEAPAETTYEKFEEPKPEPVVEPEVEDVLQDAVDVEKFTYQPREDSNTVDFEALSKSMDHPIRPEYEQTGLLKPIIVEEQQPEPELTIPEDPTMIPIKIEPPVLHREEITKSTLGIVPPDPHTIVDAHRHPGFRPAANVKN